MNALQEPLTSKPHLEQRWQVRRLKLMLDKDLDDRRMYSDQAKAPTSEMNRFKQDEGWRFISTTSLQRDRDVQ